MACVHMGLGHTPPSSPATSKELSTVCATRGSRLAALCVSITVLVRPSYYPAVSVRRESPHRRSIRMNLRNAVSFSLDPDTTI